MAESSDRTRPKTPAAPLYLFRGRAYPVNALFTVLLDVLADSPQDREAIGLFRDLLTEQLPDTLIGPLLAGLQGVEVERHTAVLELLAGAIATSPARMTFLEQLCERTDVLARHFALVLTAKLSLPLTTQQLKVLHVPLGDRRVPRAVRIDAVVQLCRTTLREPEDRGKELIQAFLSGARRGRALRRLMTVQQRLGSHPLVDALLKRVERRARMTCPRCQVQLRRPKMLRHLWDVHQLLLEGRTVREPWAVIEDWLKPYPNEVPEDMLNRCRALAKRIDPAKGPAKLQELLRVRHAPLPVALPAPEMEAPELISPDTSSCPRCATLIPAMPMQSVPELMRFPGRITSEPYQVEVAHRGLRTRLLVRIGENVLLNGCEPGQWLTPDGAIWLLAGPFVLLALVLSLGLIRSVPVPLIPVLVLLGLALSLGLLARWAWSRRASLADRTVDYAWTMLVPRLHAIDFSLTDSRFLCGLARASIGRGQPAARALLLSTMMSRTQQALTSNAGLGPHLATLRRLAIHDAVLDGRDPIPLIVEEVARSLEGRLPLSYAEHLLDGWPTRWWTPGKKARLRVLLCDRAFEIGLEVLPLLALASAAPPMWDILNADHPHQLAQLRLLWSLRPLRPWDRIGSAITVFEWATMPVSEHGLESCPDALLIQEESGSLAAAQATEREPYPVQLLMTGRGIVLQGVLFTTMPTTVEIGRLGVLFRSGYQLMLDGEAFQFNRDPETVTERMEKLFRYLERDFMPETGRAASWQSPMVKRLLRPAGAGPCPRCNAPLLLRSGQVAVEIPQISTTELG